jgi:hypothetical protein
MNCAIFIKNRIMKHILTSILFLLTVSLSMGQTTGQISYTMDFSSDNPDMAMAIPMMQGSTMEMYFMPKKTRIDMTMGTFVKMNNTVDVKADKGLLLMEVMGNKTATELTPSKTEKEKSATPPTIEVTSETKEIIGFKCTKMISRDAEGNEVTMWVTSDLKAALNGQQQFANSNVNGVPLEFTAFNGGLNIHFIATAYNKKVSKKLFSLKVPEGYKIVTEEDLKTMGSGQ